MNKSNTIFFSIITPVYNRSDCIIRCIESVSNQDFKSFEHIIVNDGSTDNTLKEILYTESKISNLKVITYHENKGVNYARNRGIEKAKGKFIIFLDSDDTLTKSALKTIEVNIKQHPEYSHFFFNVSDRINDKTLPVEIKEFQFTDWLAGRFSGDFAHVIKTSTFNGLMFIEEFRIYEDLNWGRVLRRNNIQLFIPKVIFNRERNRADSVTRESILNNKNSMLNNYNFLYQFVDWYYNDFKVNNLSYILQSRIKKGIMLGIALAENNRNIKLINHLEGSIIKRGSYKFINRKIYCPVFYRLIQIKSFYNQIRRN